MTIRVTYHGTMDGVPGLRGHRTGPLLECGKVLGYLGLNPRAKGVRRCRHPLGKRGHGLIVHDVRTGHQQRMQWRLLKGHL